MKTLRSLSSAIIILFVLSISKADAQTPQGPQNSLTLEGTATPTGPYAAGTTFCIPYTMEFPMVKDEQKKITISYNSADLELLTDFSAATNGMFKPSPSTTGAEFITDAFAGDDPGWNYDAGFTLCFRVISASCNPVFSDIKVDLETVCNTSPGCDPDKQSVTTTADIVNNVSTPSITFDLVGGNDCTMGMYKISCFGSNWANSSLSMNLPNGASIQGVFNTLGNQISLSPGGNTWSTAGTITGGARQDYYVIINYNNPILCAGGANTVYTLTLTFKSFNPCTGAPFSVVETRAIKHCCDGTIPGGGDGVQIKKILLQAPLRYFPAPDNCKTHTYIIKVDNLSANDLNNFNLTDFLDGISTNPPMHDEIEVSKISLSLVPLFGGSASFDCTIAPTPVGGNLISLNSGTPYNANYSPTLGWHDPLNLPNPPIPLLSNLSITGRTPFPKYSSLILKITHRLGNNGGVNYDNEAQLNYSINGNQKQLNVKLHSTKGEYEPSLGIEKRVKNITDNGSPAGSTVAGPGEVLEFEIKIKNYGMGKALNVDLHDYIKEIDGNGATIANIFAPAQGDVDVSGSMDYSQAELTTIKDNIKLHLGPTGFNCVIAEVKAAPCNSFTEIVIKFKVTVKSRAVVTCNSTYSNDAHLRWEWNGVINRIRSSADINVDLFKNLMYKLEASCTGPNGPWVSRYINGIPGKPIWYRASLRNNTQFTIPTLKLMVQLPNSTDNQSTHGGVSLISSVPVMPLGSPPTDLHPVYPPGISTTYPPTPWGAVKPSDDVKDNFLNVCNTTVTNNPIGKNAIYEVVNLPAQSATSFVYMVNVPSNVWGAQYITAMGVSVACNGRCPIVKKTNLTLTVAPCDNCTCLSSCDLIVFDQLIERIPANGNSFKVTLYNIMGANGDFNIDNIDVVVHQPYDDNTGTGSTSYNKTMLPYTIGPVSLSTTLSGSGTFNQIARYYSISNSSNPLKFGKISFDIQATNIPANPKLVFPVNIVFRDKTKLCTICEKTIYLRI